jgi:hypothetical protein
MTSKSRKNEYPEFEQQLDVEAFRDSILTYFAGVSDPRLEGRSIYKLELIFFIILAAVLAGANSINQIHIFSHAQTKWIKS